MNSHMNSKHEYACPTCGSPVYAWVEEVIEHRSVIDPITGRFKRAKKVSVGNATNCSGVSCSKCDWTTTASGCDIPDRYFDGLAGDGFIALAALAGN